MVWGCEVGEVCEESVSKETSPTKSPLLWEGCKLKVDQRLLVDFGKSGHGLSFNRLRNEILKGNLAILLIPICTTMGTTQ